MDKDQISAETSEDIGMFILEMKEKGLKARHFFRRQIGISFLSPKLALFGRWILIPMWNMKSVP